MKLFLDEFVIDWAAGDPVEQLAVILLIKAIRMKCDTVVFSPSLLAKYNRKIKRYEKRLQIQPKSIKSFTAFLQDSKKTIIMDQPPNVELPQKLKEDRELVVAATVCDSEKMLITTDEKLITLLQDESITAKYKIEAIQPEKAMEKMGYHT